MPSVTTVNKARPAVSDMDLSDARSGAADPTETVTPRAGRARSRTVAPSAASIPDDELIHTWELVQEAMTHTTQRLSEGLESAGVAAPFFDVLVRLNREPSKRLPMTKLASEVSLTSGGFTKLADRMEQDGLLYRQHSAQDRRVIYAVLTDHGRDIAKRVFPLHVDDLRQHLEAVLGPDRVRQLADICRTLREAHGR